MADDPEFERRLAEQAVRVFAEEWVLAVTPVLAVLRERRAVRFNERRVFLSGVTRLQGNYTHPIRFMQILKALGTRISMADGSLHEPLCEIFTYFMDGHPNPAAYAGFNFHRWVARHSAG